MKNLSFNYEKNGELEQLVLSLDKDTVPDEFTLNMMAYNDMQYIIPAQMTKYNDLNTLSFQITGLSGMREVFSREMRKADVLSLLNSIINAFEEADSYMLNTDQLLLDVNYLYVDSKKEFHILCMPFQCTERVNEVEFVRMIVGMIKPDHSEQDPYIYDIQNTLSRDGISQLSDFRELLRKCEKGNYSMLSAMAFDNNSPAVNNADLQADNVFQVQNPAISLSEASVKAPRVKEDKKNKSQQKNKLPILNIPGKSGTGIPAIPGKENSLPNQSTTPVPGISFSSKKQEPLDKHVKAGRDTKSSKQSGSKKGAFNISFGSKKRDNVDSVVAVPESSNNCSLVINQNDEMYESYESTVFMGDSRFQSNDGDQTAMIGTGNSKAVLRRKSDGSAYTLGEGENLFGRESNHQIFGNKAIGRTHAAIIKQGTVFFISDCNSANGTFVNGRRLVAGVKEELKNGDVVKFANEEFELFISEE